MPSSSLPPGQCYGSSAGCSTYHSEQPALALHGMCPPIMGQPGFIPTADEAQSWLICWANPLVGSTENGGFSFVGTREATMLTCQDANVYLVAPRTGWRVVRRILEHGSRDLDDSSFHFLVFFLDCFGFLPVLFPAFLLLAFNFCLFSPCQSFPLIPASWVAGLLPSLTGSQRAADNWRRDSRVRAGYFLRVGFG